MAAVPCHIAVINTDLKCVEGKPCFPVSTLAVTCSVAMFQSNETCTPAAFAPGTAWSASSLFADIYMQASKPS